MRFNARLKSLEKKSAITARCRECHARLDGTREPITDLVVDFPAEPIDRTNDFCKSCGRKLVLRLEFPNVRSTRAE